MGKKLVVGLIICLLLATIGCGEDNEIYNAIPESSTLSNQIEEDISEKGYSVNFSFNTEMEADQSGFEIPYSTVSAIISHNEDTPIHVLIASDIMGGGSIYDEERLNNSFRVPDNVIKGCIVWYAGGGSEIIATYDESNNAIVFLRREVDEGTPDLSAEDCYGPFGEILKIDLTNFDTRIIGEPYVILTDGTKSTTPVLTYTGDSFLDLTVSEMTSSYDDETNILWNLKMEFEGEKRIKGTLSYVKEADYKPANGVNFMVDDESLNILPYPIQDSRDLWFKITNEDDVISYIGDNEAVYHDCEIIIEDYNINFAYSDYCNTAKLKSIIFIGNKADELEAAAPDANAPTMETPALLEPDSTSPPVELQAWQDAYAALLWGLNGNRFILCDIDSDEIPELLVGGPLTDTDKYAEYKVYTYKNETIECIGTVSTLSSSCFWLDNNGGILGYAYGAGAGGTYRSYIDDGVLCYDDEVYGYFYDGDGNYTEWFRDSDGNEVIVTDETMDEYQRIGMSNIELESYDITEANILKVIYCEI